MEPARGLETVIVAGARDVSERRVELRVEADESGSWPLLMVPGFGDNLHTWQGLRETLRDRGARCVRIDLPGFGDTPLPAPIAERYVLETARVLLAAARRWGGAEPVTAIGNSLGASALLCAAALEADGPGPAAIGSAVLLSPATLETRTPPFVRLLTVPTYRWMERLQRRVPDRSWRAAVRLVVRLTMRGMLAGDRPPPRAWVESVAEALARPGAWTRLEQVAREMRRVLRREADEVEALLAREVITPIPLVLARGAHDPVIGAAELDALLPRLPAGRRVELPGVGHCPQVEAPAETARLVLETRGRA